MVANGRRWIWDRLMSRGRAGGGGLVPPRIRLDFLVDMLWLIERLCRGCGTACWTRVLLPFTARSFGAGRTLFTGRRCRSSVR